MMDDITKAVTMDLKEAGNRVYLVGDFVPVFGGSHFDTTIDETIPLVSEITPQVYKALHNAINSSLIRSAHDLSEGGLAVAAAEMCIGGRLGLDINPPLSTRDLFGETTGCLLVEVSPANIARFEETFKDLPFKKLGQVISEPVLKIGETSIDVEDLTQAFNTPL